MNCFCVKCREARVVDKSLTNLITNKCSVLMKQGPCPVCGMTCNTFLKHDPSKPPAPKPAKKQVPKVTAGAVSKVKHAKISPPVFPPPPETLPPQDTPLEAPLLTEQEAPMEVPVETTSGGQETTQCSGTVLSHVLESNLVLTPSEPHA